MSNFKFKEGDLVEVTKSTRGNEGHRFVIDRYKVTNLLRDNDSVYMSDCNSYETDLSSNGGVTEFTWAPECHLRLVNPDIDNISESTFSEIMDEITETVKVEQ